MSNALGLQVQTFRKDTYIIIEGRQNADRFFIIKSGNVQIEKEVKFLEDDGKILQGGDFFGVVSTMSAHNYIETARAVNDAELIIIMRDQYSKVIQKNANIAISIIEAFSRRMRLLDDELAQRALKARTEDDRDHLFHVAEYYFKRNVTTHAHYVLSKYAELYPDGKFVDEANQYLATLGNIRRSIETLSSDQNFVKRFKSDTMIFSESMPGDELYIIQQGSIKITKIIDDSEVLLAVLKPGDIFGEMALIEDKPRSASAIAYEDTTLLSINKSNFSQIIAAQPQISERITTLFAERIWLIYKQLANTQIRSTLGRLYDSLHTQLEKARIPVVAGKNHTFDFGTGELLTMIGISEAEGGEAVRELFRNNKIRVDQNRIHVTDVEELAKQTEYYHKQMAKRHLSRTN